MKENTDQHRTENQRHPRSREKTQEIGRENRRKN